MLKLTCLILTGILSSGASSSCLVIRELLCSGGREERSAIGWSTDFKRTGATSDLLNCGLSSAMRLILATCSNIPASCSSNCKI